MNVLALVQNKEDLHAVTTYVQKVTHRGDKIRILNIVGVSGDIPTTKDGTVLEGCTEFDLSSYHNSAAENRTWIGKHDLDYDNMSGDVIVGNRKAIIKNEVDILDIDFIVTTSEQSNETLDLIQDTRAGRLKKLGVPVLAIKCERCEVAIEDIAIVSDFKNVIKESDWNIVKSLMDNTGATVTLYAFCDDITIADKVEHQMDRFIDGHNLQGAKKVLIDSKNKEKSAQELLVQYSIQLMVVQDIKRKGLKSVLKGNLEADILNHTLIPILAY